MTETEMEASIQRTLGIGSIVFAVIQVIVFIVTLAVSNEVSGEVLIILVSGVLVFAVMGILQGILGISRITTRYKKICIYGIASNALITLIAFLATAINATS